MSKYRCEAHDVTSNAEIMLENKINRKINNRLLNDQKPVFCQYITVIYVLKNNATGKYIMLVISLFLKIVQHVFMYISLLQYKYAIHIIAKYNSYQQTPNKSRINTF